MFRLEYVRELPEPRTQCPTNVRPTKVGDVADRNSPRKLERHGHASVRPLSEFSEAAGMGETESQIEPVSADRKEARMRFLATSIKGAKRSSFVSP